MPVGTKGNWIIENTPFKLTEETQEKICGWLRKGNMRTTAAILGGIAEQTMHNWMATGEVNPDSRCGEFRRAVLQAEKDHEADLVAKWAKINDETKDFRSIQNLLERRHRKEWEPPATKTEISGPGGGAIKIGREDLEVLSVEELEQYEALVEKMAQAKLENATKLIDAPSSGPE